MVMARDPRHALDRFLLLRTIVACLVVGAGVTIVALTENTFNAEPLYLLLAVSAVIGGIALALLRLGVDARRVSWGVVVADIGFSAGIVYFSGGVSGQFTTVFCLAIAAAAFLLEMPGGLVTGVLSSACFVTFQLLETWNVIAPPGKSAMAHPHMSGFVDAYMHASMFLLVGTVGGYLADRIKLKGRALQHAESALEQLRIDTNYILENMSSGVLVVDTDANVLTMNAAAEEILELRKEEVLARHVEESLGRRMPDLAQELIESLASERIRRRQEISGHSRAGAYRPMGISISPLTDGTQRRRGVIAVFQDLTEVHEMRERVRKADRLAAVGELSAGIAHELRNPLASISGSIEMLYHELALDGENKRLMELIMRESDRLDRIISDFLEFARLRTPRRVPSKLARCIDDVVTLVKQNTEKSVAGHLDGRRADAPGVHEPRRQRVRGDGEWRHARDQRRAHERSQGPDRVQGQRSRHRARRPGEDVRAVLHHQGWRHWPGPGDGQQDCHRARWKYRVQERRARSGVHDCPAGEHAGA
jgi:two-component system sensor histidine kinase PilS (NtrC family)